MSGDMGRDLQVDQILDSWFTEGPTQLPDRTVAAVTDHLDDFHQRRPLGLLGRIHVNRFVAQLGGAAAVLMLIVLAANFVLNHRGGLGSSPSASPIGTGSPVEPTVAPSEGPSPTPQPSPLRSDGEIIVFQPPEL